MYIVNRYCEWNVDIKLFILTVVFVHWILNFVELPTHENHENWYPTNESDFTVSIYDIHVLGVSDYHL
jgi:hypothetical protein